MMNQYSGPSDLEYFGSSDLERRSGKDRRTKCFGDFRWFLKTGRRRHVRRRTDQCRLHLLDLYPPKLFYLLILILILSLTDAMLTIWLIDKGAVEINPVMAYYISLGPGVFICVKYMVTAAVVILGLALNHIFVRFLRIKFGQMLNLFAGSFALVVGWELFLVARIVI